jgi:hypothetical protein
VPTIKFGLGNKSEAEAGAKYTGKRPPHKTIYRVRVKRLGMKINSSGDYMLNCVCEVNESSGSAKEQYNGYGFWWNGNITDKGAGYINQFLNAISGGKKAVRDAFWGGKTRVEGKPTEKQATPVQAIGPLKIDQEGLDAIVYAELGKPFKGNQELVVGRWLMTSEVPDDADQDEGEESDDDDVEVDVDDVDDVDDADDEDDADLEEDDEDDEDSDEDDEDGDEPPF